jgi:hypothetical protein
VLDGVVLEKSDLPSEEVPSPDVVVPLDPPSLVL